MRSFSNSPLNMAQYSIHTCLMSFANEVVPEVFEMRWDHAVDVHCGGNKMYIAWMTPRLNQSKVCRQSCCLPCWSGWRDLWYGHFYLTFTFTSYRAAVTVTSYLLLARLDESDIYGLTHCTHTQSCSVCITLCLTLVSGCLPAESVWSDISWEYHSHRGVSEASPHQLHTCIIA